MSVVTENETRAIVKVDSLTTIGEPMRYYVVMHNDDTTPFDFVIDVLVGLFRHTPETASDLANKIHNEERAIVGMYNLEIAEQKIEETIQAARSHNYQLSVTMENVD